MRALGCYIFSGAFTLGVQRHFEVEAHLEDKPYPGTDTSKLNLPHVPIYFRSDPGGWPLDRWRGAGLDLIYANPPCAVFSPIGVSTLRGPDAWRTDARTNCWLRSYSLIELEPKMLVIESVPQALTRGREMVDALALDAIHRGYAVTYLEHDAGVLGVPQHRKRFFFVAHKLQLRTRPINWAPVPTVGETIREVEDPGWRFELREDLGAVYPSMRKRANGKWESIRQAWCRERGVDIDARNVEGMPMFMLHRLSAEHPAGAFCGSYWLHPEEPRYLGINEIKALCGYPADFQLAGRPGIWPTLIAQAVLPPVGDWVGATARLTIEDGAAASPRVEWLDIRKADVRRKDLTAEVVERNAAFPVPVPEAAPGPRPPRAPRVNGSIRVDHAWLDKVVRVNVPTNPRRPGSETFKIFEFYETGRTVRDFINRGGRIVDVKHDLERDHISLLDPAESVGPEPAAVLH